VGSGSRAARKADAAGACRAEESRDREVVADRQGGKHQGGMKRRVFLGGNAMRRRRFLQLAASAAALPAVARIAQAQPYPLRPVHILVGFPGGSASDTTARLIGQWLSERLGPQFLVENPPGAARNLAADAAAHS